MSSDVLKFSNSTRQIYHPKYKKLETDTITLEDTFQNYSKELLFEDVIGEISPHLVLKQEKQH